MNRLGRRVRLSILLFLTTGLVTEAKPFRVAGLYATAKGHFNCTCNYEAACITRAVFERANREGVDILFSLVGEDYGVISTLDAANRVASQGFDAAVGTLMSSDAIIAGNVFEKAHIPFIVPTASNPAITANKKYITRVAFNDYRQAKLLGRLAVKDLHAKSIAIIRNVSHPYSDFLGRQFKTDAKLLDSKVTIRDFTVIDESIDFKALVENILSTQTDLIFVSVAQTILASIYVELELRGASLTILSSDTIEGDPQFLDRLGAKSGKIHFIFPKHWNEKFESPESERYFALYKAYCSEYQHSMTLMAAYDAAELLSKALRDRPTARGKTLIQLIRAQKYHGLTGSMIYGPDGDPIKPLELFEISKGKSVYWKRYE